MKLKTVKVGNAEYDIHIETQSGEFYATNAGGTTALTLTMSRMEYVTDLLQKRQKAKRVRISIPFVLNQGRALKDVVVTGKHKSNDKWLVKIDGESEQMADYSLSSSNAFRVMTDEEKATYMRLTQNITEAQAERERFVRDKKLVHNTLRKDVEKAWQEAAEKVQTVVKDVPEAEIWALAERAMEVRK